MDVSVRLGMAWLEEREKIINSTEKNEIFVLCECVLDGWFDRWIRVDGCVFVSVYL